MTFVPAADHWAQTPPGCLFVRVWNASTRAAGAPDDVPLVLFHDSLGCVELWRAFPERLRASTGKTVIAYDRLGHGRSDPHPDGWSTAFIQEEADIFFPAIREQLGIREFVALGHSVGGAMAVHCAAQFATECRSLVTESAQSFVEDRTLAGIRAAAKQFQEPAQLDRLRKYHGAKAERVLNAWTEIWLSHEFSSWNLDSTLPRVRCPALVIHGDQDEYGSVRHAERLARLASGRSRLEILPGCGHVPHQEQEARVIALVTDFLANGAGP